MGIDEAVLCFRKEDLPNKWLGESIALSLDERELKARFAECPFEFRPRRDVEADSRFKQIIPYVIVMNSSRKILSYQRRGSETRLHELWSVGVGGHVNSFDCTNPGDAFDTLLCGMKRECSEELGVHCENFRLLGVINEEITKVGEVHLGIVFLLYVDTPLPAESLELGEIRFWDKKELQELKFELWSELALKLI